MTEIALVMVVASSLVCAGMLAVALGHAEGGRADLVERANLALLDASMDLSVVVPYYNPGRLLVPTIERLLSVLDASGASYEVVAVSDGSTDGSDRDLDELAAGHPQLTNLVFAQNQGKGAALRIGLARGRGRYLGFIDADGDLDPILLDSFQTMVRLYSPDIILGSKRHPLSEVEYPFLRRVYSWGYQQVVRVGVPTEHPRHPDRDQAHPPGRARRRPAPHGGEALRLRPRAFRDRPSPRLQAVPRGPDPPAPPVHEHGLVAFGLPFAPRHPGHLVPAPRPPFL